MRKSQCLINAVTGQVGTGTSGAFSFLPWWSFDKHGQRTYVQFNVSLRGTDIHRLAGDSARTSSHARAYCFSVINHCICEKGRKTAGDFIPTGKPACASSPTKPPPENHRPSGSSAITLVVNALLAPVILRITGLLRSCFVLGISTSLEQRLGFRRRRQALSRRIRSQREKRRKRPNQHCGDSPPPVFEITCN